MLKAIKAGVLGIAAVLPAIGWADYQAGLDAYLAGDFVTARSEWRAVASGSPDYVHPAVFAETHYALGMLYWKGEGVPQDMVRSSVWLKQAAEMNHRGAQVKLGYLYSAGEGVQQNFTEARKWLEMAAAQGDPDALYNLGVFYRDGLGVIPDEAEAMKWFRQAALKGDVVSAGIVAQQGVTTGAVESETHTDDEDATRYLADQQATPTARVVRADPVDSSTDAETGESAEQEISIEETEPPDAPAVQLQAASNRPQTTIQGDQSEYIPDELAHLGADIESMMIPGGAETIETTETSPVSGEKPQPVDALEDSPVMARMGAPMGRDAGEDWIRSRDGEHYTIQVVALRQPDKLYDFMDRYPQLSPFAIYRQLRYENPLWVLLQGEYDNVQAARDAVAVFPRDLAQRDKLWIRQFKMVQGLIE
jgi:septal ring-binding cell division protein DamX